MELIELPDWIHFGQEPTDEEWQAYSDWWNTTIMKHPTEGEHHG